MNELFQKLEQALQKRNPSLLKLLQPGLPQNEVRKHLSRAKVEGEVNPIIALYTWRNGTLSTPEATLEEMSPFPESSICLEDLELMCAHFQEFEIFELESPGFKLPRRRYYPIMWDSSSQWLAIDLEASMRSRVILFDTESPDPIQELYPSFERFLEDAIRANQENKRLSCFECR